MADDSELAAVKRRLQAQQERIDELQASIQQQNRRLTETLGSLGVSQEQIASGIEYYTSKGLSRRTALTAMVAVAGGAGFFAGHARGEASTSDAQGDVGSPSSPFDGFADGWALVTESVSTGGTVTKPVVMYDSVLSSFTLQISSDLEGPSGFTQPVTFLDRTGNAGSNPVTVQASDGSTIATIPASNSIFQPMWDGSNWLTHQYIPELTVGDANISGAFSVRDESPDFTISGDNNPVDIWTTSDADGFRGGFLFVEGRIDGASDAFTDLVLVANLTGVGADVSRTRGSVGTRSYDYNNNQIRLAIDDTGETYNVHVDGIGGST